MLRSTYASSALSAVLLVALPFLGSTGAGLAGGAIASSGTGSSAPIVAGAAAREGDDSTVPLVEYVERRLSADASDEPTDDEHTAQSPEATAGPVTGTDDEDAEQGSSGSGSSGGTGGSSGSSGSGSSGSGSTPPAPSTPPSPSTPPAPPAAPACPAAISGSTPGAPSRTSPLGVAGTTSADLQSFAQQYNAIRVANCLPPVPFANIRYDRCMEDRLFWMAEDPSTDPSSAWGHIGSERSDGVPSVGCDGNLAGGSNNSGATVAQKWWDSSGHRTSLYKPTYTGSTAGVCILFAMTHGGVPNEPYSFTRAAARWVTC
jgi:hypothetical protein